MLKHLSARLLRFGRNDITCRGHREERNVEAISTRRYNAIGTCARISAKRRAAASVITPPERRPCAARRSRSSRIGHGLSARPSSHC